MGGRATVIEKMAGGLMLAFYIFYVLPYWHPASVISTFLLVVSLGIIAWALARFLAGDSDKIMLVVIGLVIFADAILFILNPGGVTH